MAASPDIVPATIEHARALDIRQPDIDEMQALGFPDANVALVNCVRSSTYAWTGFINGEMAAIFGVSPASIMGGVGYPWLLGSGVIVRHPISFLRPCQPYINRMAGCYDVLHNYVDDRNRHAIKWLRWLGFEVGEPMAYGPLGMPFRHFEMRSSDV